MNEANLSPDLIDRFVTASSRVLEVFVGGEHWLFIFIALLPALAWFAILSLFQRENKWLTGLTFLAGILSVIPIFALEAEIRHVGGWITQAAVEGVAVILLSALWVGIYEEYAKNWAMRKVDDGRLRNIDDAILFAMMAGLGFAFIENVFYFYQIANNPLTADSFGSYAILRILLSNTLHVVASGIFGYFYGLAHFASEEYQAELQSGRKLFFTKWVHKVLHLKSETAFHEEKMMEGLIFAAGLHGLFNGFMGLAQHLQENGHVFGKFFLIAAVPLLGGSLWWLISLLGEKENRKELGHLTNERTSPEAN